MANEKLSPSQAFQNILDDLHAGKIQEAYEQSSAQFKEISDLAGFKDFYEKSTVLSKIKDVSLIESIDDGEAHLTGSVNAEGKDHEATIKLVDEDGVWKVAQIDIRP